MDKHIPALPCIFNPLEGGAEGVGGILRLAVVEVELEVDEVFRVGEVQINPRTYSSNFIILQLLDVVCEIIATNPYFAEVPLAIDHLLSLVIIGPKHKHSN
jgi:hypothetical protein